jgi:hypothetical protein
MTPPRQNAALPLPTPPTDMTDVLPPLPTLRLGRYRHYKGGEYEVVAAARHSESLEPMVVYKPLYADRGWWVRPLGMFLEEVEIDGSLQPRFAYLGPGVPATE